MVKAGKRPAKPKSRSARFKGKRSVHWRKDRIILARIADVEPLHLRGLPETAIAKRLGIPASTVHKDIVRCRELWAERIKDRSEELRSEIVAGLEDVKRKALDDADFDRRMERAVILDEEVECADGEKRRPYRPEKGSVQFRGNKSGSMGVAKSCLEAQAKILGLVIDKQEITGAGGGPLQVTISAPVLAALERENQLLDELGKDPGSIGEWASQQRKRGVQLTPDESAAADGFDRGETASAADRKPEDDES